MGRAAAMAGVGLPRVPRSRCCRLATDWSPPALYRQTRPRRMAEGSTTDADVQTKNAPQLQRAPASTRGHPTTPTPKRKAPLTPQCGRFGHRHASVVQWQNTRLLPGGCGFETRLALQGKALSRRVCHFNRPPHGVKGCLILVFPALWVVGWPQALTGKSCPRLPCGGHGGRLSSCSDCPRN